MTDPGWYPPRGAVQLAMARMPDGEPGWVARCASCGWQTSGRVKAALAEAKRYHRCPAGTRGALPACPVCFSTARRCYRDLGGSGWHEARQRLYDDATKGA